jgi:hypothetical protein
MASVGLSTWRAASPWATQVVAAVPARRGGQMVDLQLVHVGDWPCEVAESHENRL